MHKYDENEVLRDAFSCLNDEVPPMPEGLHAAWMQQVEASAVPQKQKPSRPGWAPQVTRFLSVAAAVVFIIGGTILTKDELSLRDAGPAYRSITLAGKRDAADMAAGAAENGVMMLGAAEPQAANYLYTDSEAADGVMMARTMSEDAAVSGKKIIRNASMNIATQTYEDSLTALRNACLQCGGWMQSSSESVSRSSSLRTAHLTMRIPHDELDGCLADLSDVGRVTYRSESATDVTESYRDTEARLATQQALMARLQALMTDAADLSDLLDLESQMAETQYELDRLQSSLNRTDRQVLFSTVDVTLSEETAPALTDDTVSLGERLKAGIALGWETLTVFLTDMVVFLVAALPFIGIVVVLYVVIRVIRKIKRR